MAELQIYDLTVNVGVAGSPALEIYDLSFTGTSQGVAAAYLWDGISFIPLDFYLWDGSTMVPIGDLFYPSILGVITGYGALGYGSGPYGG